MKDQIKKGVDKVNSNIFTRNLVLAICGLIVFLFLASLSLKVITRHNSKRIVPEFKGMLYDEAMRMGRKMSLKIEVSDSLYVPSYEGGVVLDQSPNAGSKVKPGRRVFLTVNSFHQKIVKIPYVTGFSLRQAKNNLEVAGFEIEKLVYQNDIATNNVLKEMYQGKVIQKNSKIEAEMGSGVTLIVGRSSESKTQAVPKVVGFPVKEAKSRLWEAGMNVKFEMDADINLISQSDARVYIQTPEQGTRVPLGTVVSIKLTLDKDKIEKGSLKSDRSAKAIISSQNDDEESETEKSEENSNE